MLMVFASCSVFRARAYEAWSLFAQTARSRFADGWGRHTMKEKTGWNKRCENHRVLQRNSFEPVCRTNMTFTPSRCHLSASSHCERRPLIRPSTLVGYVPLRTNTSIRDMMEVDLRALFAPTGWRISPRFTRQ